jgi:acyl-coenzyme A synthetase/AMP-(fatty) acid ligase
LIRPGTLPKTTSGKIQRSLARKLWLEGRFEDLGAGAD